MKALADIDIVIVGLGLMGASLAGALRGKCRTVVGVGRREETVTTALERGWIDRGSANLTSCIDEADVVVLATPVRTIMEMLDSIAPILPSGTVVIDLGSTKGCITDRMARLPPHIQPLGGHPMCGREVSGIDAADPTLYQGCTFILTPLERTSPETLALGYELVEAVGAHPLILTPERHDRLVAVASHLPYLLACALVATAEKAGQEDPMVWKVCASGFRDSSRLAASEITMMLDILLTNRSAVLQMLEMCDKELHQLAELVASEDEEGLRAALTVCRERRRTMYTH